MSAAVVATVFVLVAAAELPDKTMIATLVMGSRSRPLPVWIGASAAFLVQVTIAVVAGRLLELLPHRDLEIVVTTLFAAGAVYLLLVPERNQESEGLRRASATRSDTARSDTARCDGEPTDVAVSVPSPEAGATVVTPTKRTGRPATRIMATAFGVILIGELGDLTQLLTVNLVDRYHQPISVFTGALGALVAVSALGAFGGQALLRFVPLAVIRRIGGAVLAGFAAYGIYSLVR